MSRGAGVSLGFGRSCGLQGEISGEPWAAEKRGFLLGEMWLPLPALCLVGFSSQAANLTAVVDEKEQSLQEKAEVILQKEQEIFQLKKGHDSALLQMHQLQSELEALQSLRADESEATTRLSVLRLPGPEQGLAHSAP
ncbi:golgin subfamily A member 1-like, partial [Suricata suricatta]|uniref:golgin subfamily A member 1-like n=1 Tax=Suricata suricatta TaxID=37032 RepID=UPI001155EBE9